MAFYTRFPVRNIRGITRLHDDIDDLFGRFFNGNPAETATAYIAVPLDVTSTEVGYTLKLELPGVDPARVGLQIEDGSLVIFGEKTEEEYGENTRKHVTERTYGSFRRSLQLPDDADVDAITARAKDGILTIAVPRKKPQETQSRNITITRG